jgi:hypothetical protein
MTQDELIRIAVQCQLVTAGNRDGLYMNALTEFAAMVAATEREECAKVCNDSAYQYSDANEYDDFSNGCNWCAGAIRARGQE